MTTLYISDLDHTLLRSDAMLSDHAYAVLSGLMSRGVLFTYATARSHGSARRATRGLPVRLPVITYGGTMTVDAETGDPAVVRHLSATALRDILDAVDRAGMQALVHTYAGGRDRISWIDGPLSDGVAHFLRGRPGDARLAPVRTWGEIDHGHGYYVSIIGDRAQTAALRAHLAPRLADCLLVHSEDTYAPGVFWLEIHTATGSKAHAARRLADEVGATHLVAFGDNDNDIPLFEIADESYAVANAVPGLRRLATGVIGANDTDAVVDWLAAHAQA
jgi:hydroxymethylpyrimidine pyrophosphatase-like HAD family hydrolase